MKVIPKKNYNVVFSKDVHLPDQGKLRKDNG